MQNSMKWFLVVLSIIYVFLLISCSGEYIYRKDVEQLSKPGALDLPLTGFYSHYQYKLLDRYQVKHQWLRESSCGYRDVEIGKYESKDRLTKDRFFNVRDIFEEGGSTWQRFETAAHNYNFDRYVRPQYTVQTRSGLKTEKGYNVLCLETWWVTSHSIALFLRKQPLDEMKVGFSKWYPEGIWTTKKINNLTWHVQETSEDKFRPRPINGVGGPFQTWVLPLADTGYTIAIELGASKESLQYPDAHARMQAMFMHLIESVKIEPLQIGSANVTPVTTELAKPAPLIKPTTTETKELLPKNNSSTSIPMREFPDKTQQLQQDMQTDSSSDMKNLLRNTAPKIGR